MRVISVPPKVCAMEPMRIVRYGPEHQEPMLALHRSEKLDLEARLGYDIAVSDDEEEADLRNIELLYLQPGGEFLIGLTEGVVMAMGGFQRLSDDSAELRRMRIRKDLQDNGYGGQLLRELERIAFQAGISRLSFETARARPLTLEFYHKHGYHETGTGWYGNVETVHFSKTLN
jgi:GNAT superfamily N-acetyltransferase